MSKQKVRKQVTIRAKNCCEYCKARADFGHFPFVVEHIIPKSRGGTDELDNLAFACGFCNGAKYNKISAFDPISQQAVSLFHPRLDNWEEHFLWDKTKTIIVGYTATGRASVTALKMNMKAAVNLRRVLRDIGLHPPS